MSLPRRSSGGRSPKRPIRPEQTVIVIPGGRAALATYKTQRDPSLAARIKDGSGCKISFVAHADRAPGADA